MTSNTSPGHRNPLLVPLVAISGLCVAEAVAIAFLVGRGRPPEPVAVAPGATPTQAPQQPAEPHPATAAAPATKIVRGTVGKRAESGGLALTVMKVANEPELGAVFKPSAGQKFVDVDLVIENNTGRRFDYYSTDFSIKDDQDRAYSSGALGAGDPQLGWGQIVTGEKVRGHVAFVVPKDAAGLRLVCPPPATPGAGPIHVDLRH